MDNPQWWNPNGETRGSRAEGALRPIKANPDGKTLMAKPICWQNPLQITLHGIPGQPFPTGGILIVSGYQHIVQLFYSLMLIFSLYYFQYNYSTQATFPKNSKKDWNTSLLNYFWGRGGCTIIYYINNEVDFSS